MKKNSSLYKCAALAVLVTGSIGPISAQTWQNAGTDWGTAANWTVGVPDTNTETATFGTSATPINPDLATNFTIKSLLVTGTSTSYSIGGAGTLTLDINDTVTSNRLQVLNGSHLTFNTNLTLDNTASGTIGSRIVLSGASSLTFSAGTTLTLNRGLAIQATGSSSGIFNFYGVVNTGTNSLTHQGGGTAVYFRAGSQLIGDYRNSLGDTFFETGNLGANQLSMIGSLAGDAAFYISANGLTVSNNVRIGNTNAGPASRTIGVNIAGGGVGTWSGQIDVSQNTGTDIARTVRFTAAANNRANLTGNIISTSTLTDEVQIDGAGTVIIAGNSNTYSTATTVASAGTLLVNNISGSATGVGSLTVNGTLGGTGRIAPTGANGITVVSGGVVSPGDGGIESLELNLGGTTGSVTFAAGSEFVFDLNAPGVSDVLAFTGLSLASDVVFNGNTIDFIDLGGLAIGTYTLFTFDGANDYTGTLVLGTGLEGFTGNLVYNANDIQLEVTAVPEPSTYVLVLGGGLVLALLRRKVKQA